MTELQNNDLVSKLGAASPVENLQTNQVNLSDNMGKTAPNQVIMNGEPPQDVTIPEGSNGVVDSVENKTISIPSTETTNNTNINNVTVNKANNSSVTNNVNDIITPQSSDSSLNATAQFSEQAPTNSIISEIPQENGSNLNGTINEIVGTEPQKISNIINTQSKTESKAEYWKGLVSGILVSLCLFATGTILYDHGSLVVSASNAIKLTDSDTANEIVKMENAVAFGDSLSSNYINNLIGKEKNENILNEINVDNTNTEIQPGDDENSNENNVDIIDDESILKNELIDEDEINDEDLDENNVDIDNEVNDEVNNEKIDDKVDNEKIDNNEDEAANDGKLITKNNNLDEDKDSQSSNTQKSNNTSSKNKMAGSIVSIFDENDKENAETNDIDSDEISPISYKHVDNVEDANRVISANCDNPHCGDISESNLDDLVLCTEFRQSDRLDDSSNRIGSNGICRYKDSSELVYIELD